MSLPTASSQMGRRIAQFPNRPSQLPSAQAQEQGLTTAAPAPREEPARGGNNEISDFQWIVAWAALGLVLWLMARTAIGYRLIYYTLVILILTILLVQYQWFSSLFAPFAQLAGNNKAQQADQGNQVGYNPAKSSSGPKSPPNSPASTSGAAVATANSAGTLASFA